MTPKLIQTKGVYDFDLCKVLRIICQRTHEHCTQKNYDQIISHDYERRSRVDDKVLTTLNKQLQTTLIYKSKLF